MMQSTEGISDSDGTKPKISEDYREDEAKENAEKVRVLSVDKVTVEKIVLESSNGSREVLLTKNETSKKLSLRSETGKRILKRCKDERKESTGNARFRVSLPEDLFTSRNTNILNGTKSKLPISKTRKFVASSCNEKRIRPIKLTKSPSIGSLVVGGLRSAHLIGKREKVPPKVPEKPNKKRHRTDVTPSRADSTSQTEGKSQEEDCSDRCEETQVKESEGKTGCTDASRGTRENKSDGIEEQNPEETAVVDKDAQDRLDKSQSHIEILQKNLSTKIHASTAQSYKEKLLGVRASYSLKFDPVAVAAKPSERIGASAFDQDFLERHNLDRKLKIEEKRLLETDFDYVSDAERTGDEVGERRINPRKPSYSEKVSEVEKRWSGEFLENRHERNSSESSKSSYVEEFGSVSSRESIIVEDRGTSLLLERKNRRKLEERQSSVEESGRRRTSEEASLEDSSTVSTVDSDSCLEDRIKAVEEDIEVASERRETLKDDHRESDLENKAEKDFSRSNEFLNLNEPTPERINLEDDNNETETLNLSKSDREEEEGENNRLRVEQSINVSEGSLFGSKEISLDSIDSASFAIRDRPRKDGYASLIKEFTMEAGGSSRTKKEEKQKKKLGLRRLLPGIFSPKDSRKDYKKKEQKEQKERKRHDEKHFARYQQNGNYTRSPDTMNLNEDIKRNVKLDNSLNGSVIEERLDEIKRELFPDEGPITSTPDHFSESEKDQRSLRDRARAPRSYGTDSSLSSIAPDDRWTADRNLQLGISPDVRKYEVQRQKREECSTRYGQLERKHSLQEHHGNRSCFLQRNHGPSGRISAPPAERRYVVRPRAIHPVDRPLPAIPRSRVELSTNYENYQEETGNTLRHEYVPDNSEYLSQPGFYENGESPDATSSLVLTPVSAQVKITRQPIINQTQRAPLVGRTPKYPSPGSSQRSADYADSSCTPNSSQKSEFSPSSSKSGEYYLHSPRTSARTSPNDRAFEDTREGIYENENENENGTSHSARASENRYVEEERVYDETPPSPCVEEDEGENEGKCERYKKTESALTESITIVEKQTIKTNGGTFPTSQQDSTEKLISPTSPSSGRSRISISSRRSQPTDQILIASPKREALYEPRASRAPNQPRFRSPESPVPIADATGVVTEVRKEFYEGQDVSRKLLYRNVSSPGRPFSKDIPRPEPIYGHRRQRSPCLASSPPREGKKEEIAEEKVAWIQGQSVISAERKSRSPVRSDLTNSNSYVRRQEELRSRSVSRVPLNTERSTVSSSQEQIYSSRSPQREYPIYDRHQRQQSQLPQLQQQQLPRRSVYIQRMPEQRQQYVSSSPATCGPLSPSKRETRQHLEAFYWQQKALEAQKKSDAAKQTGWKIDLPEMREAVYWQQLKRLDEEQQRKIYEQKPMEERDRDRGSYERTSSCYEGGKSPMTDPAVIDADRSYWNSKLQRPKVNPAGKPPLMQGQKGVNQPVLIVRPQQAIRDRHEIPQKPSDIQELRRETQRSKSASPHFHRGDDRSAGNIPRQTEECVGSSTKRSEKHVAVEQENIVEVEGKPPPPPIFKRGSLLSSDSVEYGSTGPKRVSFSNQPNSGVGPEISASGSWPTKHGTAPEPPTRRHRSEDSASDDSVFFHRDHPGLDTVYNSNLRREESVCGVIESEYDANRPLPPPPSKDSPAPWSSRGRGNCLRSSNFWNVDMDSRQGAGSPGNPKKWHAGSGPCESESGSEAASEVQRIFRRKQGDLKRDTVGRG